MVEVLMRTLIILGGDFKFLEEIDVDERAGLKPLLKQPIREHP